jgi:thiosulfate dehydrogenase
MDKKYSLAFVAPVFFGLVGLLGSGPLVPPTRAEAEEAVVFTPPPERSIPSGPFGDLVRMGEQIFTRTGTYAGQYVGNDLTCESCHLDRGRKAYSAPLWAAYVSYPRFRRKNNTVVRLGERIQECFRFSMNGSPPPLDSKTITAIVAYSFWMSKGAPVGVKLMGKGMLRMAPPPRKPDPFRGKKVYAARCALCHGADGLGTRTGHEVPFPPVWGPRSYNKGAGLYHEGKLAGFIKRNMPLSKGDTLSDQEAWDVAAYVDSQPRPADPRKSRPGGLAGVDP